MERTTDLEKVKAGALFTWGEVIRTHEIGEYAIVEYLPWKVDGASVRVGSPDIETTNYHCYIKGKSLSRSAPNLDSAIAECIACKHDGINSQAALFFMRMINA